MIRYILTLTICFLIAQAAYSKTNSDTTKIRLDSGEVKTGLKLIYGYEKRGEIIAIRDTTIRYWQAKYEAQKTFSDTTIKNSKKIDNLCQQDKVALQNKNASLEKKIASKDRWIRVWEGATLVLATTVWVMSFSR